MAYSRSVLLVDDNPADRALFGRELRKQGFDVIDAASAEEAITAVGTGKIGCLVTDEAMPVPGHEIAAQVQQLRDDVPIVFFSGEVKPDLKTRGGSVFVDKNEKGALSFAVESAMR